MTVNYFKFPRTPHLLFSESRSEDDISIIDHNHFFNKEIVITEKLDGENTTILSNGKCHARSIDSKNHPSRNLVKALASEVSIKLPNNWRICGENLYATHSIHYKHLPSYFMVFGIFDEQNICLSWDDMVGWCELLELEHVPLLYRGTWDENLIKSLYRPLKENGDMMEGYVVRFASSFKYKDYGKSTAKFVRSDHIITDTHWTKQKIIPNELYK